MRKIKFRYWNGITNQMVHNPEMPYKQGWTIEQLFSDRGWIWMQYTGCKDKNGTEIYEGDILKTEHGATGKVSWIDGVGYKFDCNEPFWSHPVYGMGGDKEIIGNIYENPELL